MRPQSNHRRRDRARRGATGFTLVEALLAVLLVGVGATAFSSALVAGTGQNLAAEQYVVATNLAAALMNEIVARPFNDPQTPDDRTLGPDTGEARRTGADNVDDYDGDVEDTGQIIARNGAVLTDPSLAGYSRTASVSYKNMPGRNPALPPAFALVTVEVKYNGASLVTLTRLISSEERR